MTTPATTEVEIYRTDRGRSVLVERAEVAAPCDRTSAYTALVRSTAEKLGIRERHVQVRARNPKTKLWVLYQGE